MTTRSSSVNAKVTIIAEKKIGRFKPDDEITIEKYAARALVAMGKARFKDEADDFRKKAMEADDGETSSKKKRGRYQTRVMTPQQ